jgi:metal-responsive CopG/Arc/MetJ family transcriptional regulator
MASNQTTPVMVRLGSDLLQRVDEWRRDQTDLPTRPEAIRRLVESGLRKG